jgi:hypothetical protein
MLGLLNTIIGINIGALKKISKNKRESLSNQKRRGAMANSVKQGVIIDKEIPIEMQVDFLRKGIFDRDLVTYKVLKEKLGEKADDLYFAIKEDLLQQMVKDLGMKLDFEDIKKQAGAPDKILGYRLEKDHEKPDEIQFSTLNCPY